ncbi:hypothetical protein CDCA_CDCA02G0779 [Cyanidium caldarium]|uniref:DUF547 domain-containing protein n=1 Tax=Cyanidium caldarium TaxID=2771 RepID=A0AAV9IRH9_CYACA|nr:hypothetical protein CDCA_CDCA02G0779 [Cyanidium caldarium]
MESPWEEVPREQRRRGAAGEAADVNGKGDAGSLLTAELVTLHARAFGLVFGRCGGVRMSLTKYSAPKSVLQRGTGAMWVSKRRLLQWMRTETDWLGPSPAAGAGATATPPPTPVAEVGSPVTPPSEAGEKGAAATRSSSPVDAALDADAQAKAEAILMTLVEGGVLLGRGSGGRKSIDSPATFIRYAIAYPLQHSGSRALNTLVSLPRGAVLESRYDARLLALELENVMDQLLPDVTSPNGESVDYAAVRRHPQFPRWLALATLLAWCRHPDDSLPADSEKVAFYVNIHNMMAIQTKATVHAAAPRRQADGTLARARGYPNLYELEMFLHKTYLVLCGELVSLCTLKNAVIRGQRLRGGRTTSCLSALAVKQVDPRVHFVLNWGAKSCPALRTLHLKECDAELDAATAAFLADRRQVEVVERNHTLTMSRLFLWYRGDFTKARTDLGLLEWMQAHASDPSAATTARLREVVSEMRRREGTIRNERKQRLAKRKQNTAMVAVQWRALWPGDWFRPNGSLPAAWRLRYRRFDYGDNAFGAGHHHVFLPENMC